MALQLLVAGELRSLHFLGTFTSFIVLVLCATRVYALYNKNNCILLALLALAVASVIVGFVRTCPG